MKRLVAVIGAVLVLALAGGCVSLPVDGPVQAGPVGPQDVEDDAPFYDPPGPQSGYTPVQIARGFLDAMTANPLTTAVAREYLTEEDSEQWRPEQRTIIYGSSTLSTAGDAVSMQLGSVNQLDRRGEWLGAVNGGQYGRRIEVTRERGEWRITNPPDALVVPETYFESRFEQYSLFFFDKSAQVLVPEPVHLPRGEQAPTLLVRGLLGGPDQDLLGVMRTFLPSTTEVDLSVPVSEEGVAEVPLSDDVLELSPEDLRMVSAQLLWTLRQVTGVQRIRITVDGSPVEVPGLGIEQEVGTWSEYDPRVAWASEELFGLREGRVVTLGGEEERRISGLFGIEAVGLRTIAVDLAGKRVAGVSTDGTSVQVAPRARQGGSPPTAEDARLLYSGGRDILVPGWDLYGQLWLLDNTASGALLSVVRGREATQFVAPGLSGKSVRAFELSRDGTRLVAVVNGRNTDRLVVSRVMRREDGSVRKIAPAENLPVGDLDLTEIRDIAWRTPDSVAILTGPNTGISQVIVASIDGSSALGDIASNPEVFRDEAVRIVTSPSEGVPLFVGTSGGLLFELAANGRWTGTSVDQGLLSPTFVG